MTLLTACWTPTIQGQEYNTCTCTNKKPNCTNGNYCKKAWLFGQTGNQAFFLTVGGRQKKGWWQFSFSWSPFQGSKKVQVPTPCLHVRLTTFLKLTLLFLTFKYCQCTWLMDACNIPFPRQRTLAQVHCKNNLLDTVKDSGDIYYSSWHEQKLPTPVCFVCIIMTHHDIILWWPQSSHLIQPIAQKQSLYFKDTTETINLFKKTKLPKSTISVSVDITSLYTQDTYNVPQEDNFYHYSVHAKHKVENFTITETCLFLLGIKEYLILLVSIQWKIIITSKPVEQLLGMNMAVALLTYSWPK